MTSAYRPSFMDAEPQLSASCEMPSQPKVRTEDWKHPRHGEYLRYRAAMTMQLVQCDSFARWLSYEESA